MFDKNSLLRKQNALQGDNILFNENKFLSKENKILFKENEIFSKENKLSPKKTKSYPNRKNIYPDKMKLSLLKPIFFCLLWRKKLYSVKLNVSIIRMPFVSKDNKTDFLECYFLLKKIMFSV